MFFFNIYYYYYNIYIIYYIYFIIIIFIISLCITSSLSDWSCMCKNMYRLRQKRFHTDRGQ